MAHENPAEETGHHDGIVENDHHLPNWWLATLFGSMVFAFFYWMYFHTFAVGALQAAELDAEQHALAKLGAKPAQSGALGDDELLALSKDKEVTGRGEVLFKGNCVACHGQKGEGLIGPNLTDQHWLHGGKPSAIYATITSGVVDKGMLAWGPTLGEAKVKELAAFVLTLKNTMIPGKAPQGNEEK